MRGNFVYKKIGSQITLERHKKQLSQEDLAFLSGIDRTYLCRIERGYANPSIKGLNKISRALKVKLFHLLVDI